MSTEPLEVIAGAPDRPLVIGDIEIPCYVLEDETRVLSQRGVTASIGLNPEAGFRMPQFMASRSIAKYVSADSMPALKHPVRFKNPVGGGIALGYPATLLPDICDVILAARAAGSLQERQLPIAQRCELLTSGTCTGRHYRPGGRSYRLPRSSGHNAPSQIILEEFIAKELQPWTKTFPYEFYTEIARLKGWPPLYSMKRPSVVGHYTNDIVYERIAPWTPSRVARVSTQHSQQAGDGSGTINGLRQSLGIRG